MKVPSLRRRARNGTLVLVLLAAVLGVSALPRLYELGGAIRETLYRNYVSIEAAQHMHAALRKLELAERDGKARDAWSASRDEFMHWMDIENHDFTEVGEPELAGDIEQKAGRLFADIASAASAARHDREFDQLHARLDDLIVMNKEAMFRADSRALRLGKDLTYEFAAGLALLLAIGVGIAWGLGRALSTPLTELTDRLRGISQRKIHLRLGSQKFAELDGVARQFNEMAEKLEQYEKLNVERLVYEKSKTEAIVESLEDGVVLLDAGGIVTHINEVATLIMGIEPGEALGSPFDDLSTNSPHYLRVRDAIRKIGKAAITGARVEVQLHFRGRDHSYVLKPMALRRTEGAALGTLLILQDVTYLRDQDQARANLIATLSHELRTPLTSLALSAELLRREGAVLSSKQGELLLAILEECGRMKQLTDNLLNLARGELGSIALRREHLDLGRIAAEVADRFEAQAHERAVEIARRIEAVPAVNGDPVKLSWVISNLIGNALRYSPGGGRIEISARPSPGGSRLEVADSGPGIPPEIRAHIFERFAQYEPNGAEKGSAGLGLAIVKDIVQAHGGRIFVESNQGTGSRFIVELPTTLEGLMAALLVVDDEKNIRASLVTFFTSLGHETHAAESAGQALAILERGTIAVVLTDYRMAEMNGLELLMQIRRQHPDCLVILMTAYATVENAVAAMKAGAYDYVTKPFSLEQIQIAVERAVQTQELRGENRALRDLIDDAPLLDSRSAVMNRLVDTARRAAASGATILLTGESGTGKNVLARQIHAWSPRHERPFVVINCTTLSEQLLESELFGHVRGSFTGAVKDKPGRLEAADGGTAFLDEIGDLTPPLQTKFLRFVQEQSFERVGGDRTIRVDARIVAASNRDLEAEVAAHRFRDDLYYRLNVIALRVPPLRERKEDIVPLAQWMLRRSAARHRHQTMELSQDASTALTRYDWPGNVRQLQNAIERAAVLNRGGVVSADDLPDSMFRQTQGALAHIPQAASLEELEREHIARVLGECATLEEAAGTLGINVTTLWRKRRRYGIE